MFERMIDDAGDEMYGEPTKGRLTAAWLLLIAAFAVVTAWLFYMAPDTLSHSRVPVVRFSLPSQVGEITRSDGPPIMAEAPKAEAAPEPQSLPAAPVSPLNTGGKVVPRPAKESGPDAPPAPKAAPPRPAVAAAPLEAPQQVAVAPTPTPVAPAPVTPAPIVKPEPAQPVAQTPAPAPAPSAPAVASGTGDHAPLPGQPNPALLAASPYGQLPIIGPPPADQNGKGPLGTYAWQYYAKPFADKQNRGRVAVIVTGLGLNAQVTEAAIARLPGSITLAFDPYADHLNDWLAKARAQGHEVLIGLPMEPSDYPDSDPGPATLLTSLSASDNLLRLEWVLARATAYVGVVGQFGGRFMNSAKDVLPILDALKKRGLMYVDNLPSSQSRTGRMARDLGLPRALNDLELDADPAPRALDAHFGTLIEMARSRGQAVGFASPLPATIDALERLLPNLASRNLVLAPVTALANRQSDTP